MVDSNDHVPRVSVNTLRSPPDVALLPVNADIDAFVAYVSVADPDTGSSGRVTCSLHEELAPPTHFRLQRLSPTQFQIVTSSPMDGGIHVPITSAVLDFTMLQIHNFTFIGGGAE